VTLSNADARRIWLHAQRLDTAEPFGDGPQATVAAVEHLGYVQIDTIHVIERAHHHILWSRIPAYDRVDLHQAQTVDKTVFEAVTHALSCDRPDYPCLMSKTILRAAQPADGATIAEIQLAAWRATYGHLQPAMVAELDLARTADNWARAASGTAYRLRLAEYDGTPVGYAFSGPTEDDSPGIGELHAVYLMPAAHGRGVGRVLVEDALDGLAAGGFGECVAWVAEQNSHARGFYDHLGFRADGHQGNWRGLETVRYRMALTTS